LPTQLAQAAIAGAALLSFILPPAARAQPKVSIERMPGPSVRLAWDKAEDAFLPSRGVSG